jgi:SWI/SNF-related matrix-associated actin-dependent regulator 1 of chromatin subfamily A
VKQKEDALNYCLRTVTGVDSMDVQDALLRCDWDKEKAVEELKQLPPKGNKRTYFQHRASENHYNNHHVAKKQRRNNVEDDEETASEDEHEFGKQAVFDSDSENDGSYAPEMNIQRKEVFDFFNNANVGELTCIKSCSLKKAEIIVENRPYRNWEELVTKCREKPLQTELLNNAQEFVDKRNNLKKLIKKCKAIVLKLEKAVEEGAGISEQPYSLNEDYKLSDYQLVGLNWLAVLHQNGTNGILADEMGLGKTIQIIAFLAYLKETQQQLATHVVCVPSSTLDNWANEFAKWCPSLNVARYYGSQEERRIMRYKWVKEGFEETDVILTTYHVIGSSNEDKKMFRVTNFHYVVFDEAHMLKNMCTQRYTTLLRINAQRRILLTGTPLQNSLLELMSLLCFVMPKLFANKTDDIKALFSKKAPKIEDGSEQTNDFEQSQIQRAKNIMKPFILRRLKKDVLSFLPTKSEVLEKVKLLPDQMRKYQLLIDEYKNIDPTSESYMGRGSSIMMDMRKLANHPLLMRYYFTDERLREISKVLARDKVYKNNNAKEIFEDIAPLSDLKVHQLADKYPSITNLVKIPDNIVMNSGKFKYLDTILPKLKKEGHRVLIFSQFVMMLDVIEKYLAIRGMKFVRLDGSTAVTDRQELIEEYSANPEIFIFLLSTKAGGLGINLTSADRAIIHDIDFNPYNDKQAEDRCHRIGQTKEVVIYKLIADGTIEEGMNVIAKEKLNLEREVTSNDNESKYLLIFSRGLL